MERQILSYFSITPMWLMPWKCWFYIFNSDLLLIVNNKKELVPNGFCFSFVFDFKRTWIWKRILLSSLVYALKKVFNELESSSFGGDFSGRYHVYFVFDLLNKLTKQRSASAVLDSIEEEEVFWTCPKEICLQQQPWSYAIHLLFQRTRMRNSAFLPTSATSLFSDPISCTHCASLGLSPKNLCNHCWKVCCIRGTLKLSNSSFFYASI